MQLPDPVPRPLDHLVSMGDRNSTALITRDQIFRYGELDNAVGRLASVLLCQGLVAGDRVATWLSKTVEACLLPLAAARAGLVHVPINPSLKHQQVMHIVRDCGAKLLISSEGRLATLDVSAETDCYRRLRDTEIITAMASSEVLGLSCHDPATLAAILYTSGSTGLPKGVMLSHANLWLGAVSVASYLGIMPRDRILGVLPLSFDYGQNQLFSAWAGGAAVVPLDYLTPRDVIKAVDRYQITTIAGVPPLWTQLIDATWPDNVSGHIERVTNSGGALSKRLIDELRATFRSAALYPMYGLTEAFRSTYLDPDLVTAYPTSIGRAIPFAEVMVVRADGNLTSDDEDGELVHAGPLVAQGYWHDPVLTAQKFRPAPSMSLSGGTAVWSGDTVRRSRNGLLYFIGRDDDMMKVSGNRVSPMEIENIAQASGAVVESVAFGIGDNDRGHAIALVATPCGKDAATRLAEYLKHQAPAFMVPAHIVWRTMLPRNPNGKLDRAAIKREFLS